LAPHAQQFNDRPKILASRCQPIEVTFALGFGLNGDHAGVGELLETLHQYRARDERRGSEQFAKSAGAKAQFPHDDRCPAIAENFGGFCNGTELGIREHAAMFLPPARRGKYVFRT
jgi:hypothetical protein